jgi:DNA-binding transcriptional regulator YiaG
MPSTLMLESEIPPPRQEKRDLTMDNAAFTRIRQCLGKTQRELAMLLGVSLKGVQSFEQGWRKIPAHVERQMLLLVTLREPHQKTRRPCWKVKRCTTEMKENCPAWEFQAKHFCWMINGLICEGKAQTSWNKKMEICRECPTFHSIVPKFALAKDDGKEA